MTISDPLAWSDQCDTAAGGHHFNYHYNSQSSWDCANEVSSVAPVHFDDDGRGYRCAVTWWIPDNSHLYTEARRCEYKTQRCFHEECVNDKDLEVLANKIYQDVVGRTCVVQEETEEQECQCCCDEKINVMIDCDWVKRFDNGTYAVEQPKAFLAFSTLGATLTESSGMNWDLFIGLTATISLLLIAVGWSFAWYFSPRRRYKKHVDELPPLPHDGPSATPQKGPSASFSTGNAIINRNPPSDSGSAIGTTFKVNSGPNAVEQGHLTPFADEEDENAV
jgi:hypothetical protein